MDNRPIMKQWLFKEAFDLLKKVANGENDLENAAKELIEKYDFAFSGIGFHKAEEFSDYFGMDLTDGRKVEVSSNGKREILAEFLNGNLIASLILSEEALLAMITCAMESIKKKNEIV